MAEPNLHIKPTQEELQAKIDAAQKALEEEEDPKDPLEDDPHPPADGEGEEDEEIDEEGEEGEDEGKEGEEDEESEGDEGEDKKPPVKPPVKEEPKPPTDFEKRYKDSSREAHILRENKDKQDAEIDEVQGLSEPTEDQLRTEYPDWDDLSETERKLAKKVFHAELKEAKIREIREKYRADEQKIGERAKEAEVFAIHPDTLGKFPKLEGRQEEFMAYASKPSRLVMDLEDLAKLFILDLPAPTKHKGKMFETGGAGGEKGKPKSNKLTLEQGAALKQSNWKLYVKYLKAGRIEGTVE